MSRLAATRRFVISLAAGLLAATSVGVHAEEVLPPAASYRFDASELSTLQYSRPVSRRNTSNVPSFDERGTELSFKLSPGKFDFSPSGAFGLAGVFSNPSVAIENRDGLLPEIHQGLSYSAGVVLEEDAQIPESVYVSSSQLGISYGRMGRIWYGGVDVTLGQFATENGFGSSAEVLSLDITTGRKLGMTGLGSHSPLWLLSLRGDFDLQSLRNTASSADVQGDWYLNPSLFWEKPGFTMSAQLQVPVDSELLRDFEEPDYRLRAVFEKQFR